MLKYSCAMMYLDNINENRSILALQVKKSWTSLIQEFHFNNCHLYFYIIYEISRYNNLLGQLSYESVL